MKSKGTFTGIGEQLRLLREVFEEEQAVLVEDRVEDLPALTRRKAEAISRLELTLAQHSSSDTGPRLLEGLPLDSQQAVLQDIRRLLALHHGNSRLIRQASYYTNTLLSFLRTRFGALYTRTGHTELSSVPLLDTKG